MTDTDNHRADITRMQQSSGRFDARQFVTMMAQYGHTKLLDMQFIAQGEDWVELGLPYHADLVGDQETGILASGPIISLLDNATSLAGNARRGEFVPQVTMDLRVDYMRAANPGKMVIARGECYKFTRNISFVRGIAHDGDPDDPVAHAAGTFISVGNLLE